MFVIRSMSTTDFRLPYRSGGVIVPGQQPQPYHTFLMVPEKRHGAYWCRCGDTMKFETEAGAQAEADRIGIKGYDIVPIDFEARGLPNYWDRKAA